MRDETAWLIEWPADKNMPPRWWHPVDGWVTDSLRATRFSRKEDAEGYIKGGIPKFIGAAVATEHMWCPPKPPQPDEIVSIEISFPVALKVSDEHLKGLDAVLTGICRNYEAAHPGRIMWPFGHGAKILVNPLALSDDEPIPFDSSVYQIEMAEREAYPGERNAAAS